MMTLNPCIVCKNINTVLNYYAGEWYVDCHSDEGCGLTGRSSKTEIGAVNAWNEMNRDPTKYLDDIPTTPGYYWVKCPSYTSILKVVQRPRISFLELKQGDMFNGSEAYTPVESVIDAQWCGPIKEPG